MSRVVDFHGHILHPEVLKRTAHENVPSGFGARPVRPEPGSRMAVVFEKMFNSDLHIEDMDRADIDVEVLSASTVLQYCAWADAATDLELNRTMNDEIAEWVRRHPRRFVGSFTLPLQDVDLALSELERAVDELRLRVWSAPANVHGRYLGHSTLRPIWDAVAARDLVTFIHPDGVRDPWFQDYAFWNVLGQPIEETRAMASIIYDGVFDALPDVRVVMAHGGGYLPHYCGRLDRMAENMPDTVRNLSQEPSAYLRKFHYDTCVYDPTVLEALVDRVGADRIVMGSDYPVGEKDPIGFVQRCAKLTPDDVEAVLGGTAIKLLGLAELPPASMAKPR